MADCLSYAILYNKTMSQEVYNSNERIVYVHHVVEQEKPKARPDFMKPNSGLTLAIIVTVLFNLLLGLVAIRRASKVNRLWECGFYDEAENYASSAKRWAIAGIIVGFIVRGIITLFLLMAISLSEVTDDSYYADDNLNDEYYDDPYDEEYDYYY